MSASSERGRYKKPLVIGLGNPLMGDDGAGERVIASLRAWGCSADLLNLATPGFSLITHLQGRTRVVVVDAAEFNGRPGQVRRASLGAVRNRANAGIALHDTDVVEALRYARRLNLGPRTLTLYCIQKKEIRPGRRLSPEVRAGVKRAARAILKEML
jgi:hydrogenase maturation protease